MPAQGANLPQGIPQLNSAVTNPDGTLNRTWFDFFRQLWLRTGGGTNLVVSALLQGGIWVLEFVTSSIAVVGGNINASGTAVEISTPLIGGLPQAQALGISPWTFTATFQGTLLVFGARVDFSRDAGATFFPVTLQGGAIPMLVGDLVKLTWFGDPPESVVFLPGGTGT